MWVINVKSPDALNAGNKAPKDINEILEKIFNAKAVDLILGNTILGKFKYKFKFLFTMIKVRLSKEVLVLQFPIIERNFILNIADKKRTIALIHDIDGLRYMKEDFAKLEFSKLNLFKYLIVHNKCMKKYLEDKNISAKLISLELFDYLCSGSPQKRKPINSIEDCTLVYAGNLTKEKSPFLHQLEKEKMKFKFNVYGTGTELGYLHKTVNYKGKFPPDELPDILDGNLGLIWDGSYNDEDEAYCLKNYTKYNNPHKLSLYIAAGLPVVAWKKSAIADFIQKYDIGYLIDNIYDINNIDFSNYNVKLNNINNVQKQARSGYFTTNAINKCIKEMNLNNKKYKRI